MENLQVLQPYLFDLIYSEQCHHPTQQDYVTKVQQLSHLGQTIQSNTVEAA